MQNKLQQLKRHYALAQRRHVRTVKRHAKKPVFTVPALTFMSLLVVVIVVWLVYSGGKPKLQQPTDTNIVVVNYDKKEQTIPTRAKTVGDLLKKLDVKLQSGDVVEPAQEAEIIGNNFRVNVYRSVPVTIVEDGRKIFTSSAAATARSILKQKDIAVYPEDRVEMEPTDNFVIDGSIGERIVIDRATPVNMNLYGTQVAIRTHAKTVNDLIKERNIRLGKDDTVTPSRDTVLTDATQVFFVRNGAQIQTVEEPLAMLVETVPDASLNYGQTVVRQQGAAGKKLVTYQIDLQNGVEVGRRVIQEVVAQEAVKQVVAKGTRAINASLQTWLYKLRMCESGGNYQTNTGNGYYGAYQFSQSTWDRIARGRLGIPYARADLAPPEVQDQAIIANTNLSKGGLATQNPGCFKKEGLSQFPPAQ